MSWVTAGRCNYSHRLKAHRMNGCPNYLLSWKPVQPVGKQFGNTQLFKGPSLRGVVQTIVCLDWRNPKDQKPSFSSHGCLLQVYRYCEGIGKLFVNFVQAPCTNMCSRWHLLLKAFTTFASIGLLQAATHSIALQHCLPRPVTLGPIQLQGAQHQVEVIHVLRWLLFGMAQGILKGELRRSPEPGNMRGHVYATLPPWPIVVHQTTKDTLNGCTRVATFLLHISIQQHIVI